MGFSNLLSENRELHDRLIKALPYGDQFRFVQVITRIDDMTIEGSVVFDSGMPFYHDHFKHKPTIPGVILLETIGQLGVCHVIYRNNIPECKIVEPMICYAKCDWHHAAQYGEKLTLHSEIVYDRFGTIKMKGTITGGKGGGELIMTGEGILKLNLLQNEA